MSWMLEMFTPEELVKHFDEVLVNFEAYVKEAIKQAQTEPFLGAVSQNDTIEYVNSLSAEDARLVIMLLFSITASLAHGAHAFDWLTGAASAMQEPLNRDEMLGIYRQLVKSDDDTDTNDF